MEVAPNDPVPPFTEQGLLPPGDYPCTIAQLQVSHLVHGQGQPDWDSGWRLHLTQNLAICADVLWGAGITEVYIDGSFVEEKAHPNDIDGYFVCDLRDFASGALTARLNHLDPNASWSWNNQHRRPDPDSAKWQLPMWHAPPGRVVPPLRECSLGDPRSIRKRSAFSIAFRQQRGTYARRVSSSWSGERS